MNKFAAMECPTTFNVMTSLKSCDEYKKEIQESTDPLRYRFDIRPRPMCYIPGQTFQGVRTSTTRAPPPQLLDMEMTLQSMPLKEQDNRYVVKDIHNTGPPAMPKILSNRMIIPDCKDILHWERTKIKRIDQPTFSHRMDRMGMYHTNYMRPGRDTRSEMRQAFKQYESKKAESSNIYGVGKYDPHALKPGTNIKCTNADSDLDCMHVYGPDAVRTPTVIDSTLPLDDLTAKQDTSILKNVATSLGLKGETKPPTSPGVGTGASGPGGILTAEAMRVAKSIDPNVPFVELMKNVKTKNGCNATFYNYKPASCPT